MEVRPVQLNKSQFLFYFIYFFPSSGYINTAIWTLTKCMEKKLDGNYTRMLQAVLNKFWRQYPMKQQLYGHLPPSRKPSKLDKLDIWDTAGEIGTNS